VGDRVRLCATRPVAFVAALALCLVGQQAAALSFYHFDSPSYSDVSDVSGVLAGYTTAMHVSGEITLANDIPVNSIALRIAPLVQRFHFDDGNGVLTNANASIADFSVVTTGGAGQIVVFSLTITSNDQLRSLFLTRLPIVCGTCNVSLAKHFAAPSSPTFDSGTALSGNWTLAPEPSTGLLVGFALAATALVRRRST